MASGVSSWSKTAATNASADSAVNWSEGMPPSAVNDSARGMMASVAKWRDDISGTITTGGSSTAFTVASNQGFASLAALSGALIAFIPHATSGASPTLNVDGLGAKAINASPSVAVSTGSLVLGVPYLVTYINATTEFILVGAVGALNGATIGGAVVATQAQQETGTAVNLVVTPGRQQFHASAAKAWVKFTGSTGAILASYNVTSVTRNAVGDYTVLFTVAMSSAHYTGHVECSAISGIGVNIPVMDRSAAGADAPPSTAGQRFANFNAAASFNAADPDRVYYAAFGDQ